MTIRFALAHQFLTSHEGQNEAQLNRILKLTEAVLERLIKV